MFTRFHQALIGLLIAQVVLAIVLLAHGDGNARLVDQLLLPGFDAAKVTRLQVTAGDAKPIDLVKQGSGWVLASSFDYPADASKVEALLAPIAKLAAAEPIATQTARHKQLKVADTDFARKLVISAAGGKDITLFVGTSAGLRRNAIRIAGSDDVYAVGGISEYSAPAEPHMWVNQSYVMLPKDQIAKVTIKRADATLEFTHADDGKWTATVDGGPVDPVDSDEIDHLVNDIAAIDLLEPADPKRDASAPTATIGVELKAKPGVSVAPIMLDAIVDGDRIWIHQRALDRAVVVEKSKLGVATIGRLGLVKAPVPVPPPEPGK